MANKDYNKTYKYYDDENVKKSIINAITVEGLSYAAVSRKFGVSFYIIKKILS